MTARTGSVTGITSSNQNFSQAITVPADATLFILGMVFFQTGGALPTVTLGGNSCTSVVSNVNESGEMTALFRLSNPPTGSQTLAVTWGSALEEGAHYFPAYYNDVDTTDPIRGSGNAGNGGSTATTGSITTAVGDIVVAVGGSFGSTDADVSATAGADQTEVADTNEFGTSQGAFGEKVGVAGTTTFTVAGAFVSLCAASLRDAAAGGTVNTQTLTSNVVIADQGLRYWFANRRHDDAATITDQALRYWFANRRLEDSIAVTDEALATVVGNAILTRILGSTLVVSDGVVASSIRNQILQDTIIVSEPALQTFINTNLIATDELTLFDESISRLLYRRLLGDDIAITDEAPASIIGQNVIARVLTSEITTSDAAFLWLNRYRLGESNVLAADEVQRVVSYTRDLMSLIDAIDNAESQLQRFILLTDAFSVNDFLSSLVTTPTTDNPIIRIGFDQPRIEIGGYAVV